MTVSATLPLSAEISRRRRRATCELVIDLAALARNWRKLQAHVAPAECAAVVKADAYGIGIDHAVPTLAHAGCRTFFVAHIDEGIRVRAALGDIAAKIYVLNGLVPHADIVADYAEYQLSPVLGSVEEIRRVAVAHKHSGRVIPVALHLETGMNRLGIPFNDALEFSRAGGQATNYFKIDLVMSHFISAEKPENPSNQCQIEKFDQIKSAFSGIPASLANSSGIFLARRPFHDLVRPGYALYGGNPTPDLINPMEPVVSLLADILQTRWVEAGETVGYNGIWTAQCRSRLATLAVGYADGFPRGAATGGGQAVLAGVHCPIVGRVSMDLIVVDITAVPEDLAAPGAPVELLGQNIGIDELAARSATIGYELLTGLGHRYARTYVD